MKKASLRSIFKYAIYFILLILLCNAETANGIKPFGLGLFVALVYSRQNLLVLAPMYAAAVLLSSFSVEGAIIGTVPSIILMTAYYIHYKVGRSMNTLFANLYTLLSQIPYIIFSVGDNFFTTFFTVLLTQIFAYTSIVIVYAILIRGLKYRFTIDEIISGAVFLASVALATYKVQYFGANLYFAFFSFVLLLSASVFGSVVPLAVSAVLGIGGAFAGGNISLIGTAVCCGMVVIMFKNTSIYLSAVALLITDAVLGYYFDAYSGYSYFQIIMLAVGVILFLFTPKRAKSFAQSFVENVSDRQTGKTIINRNRLDISNRIYSISNVFADMQTILEDGIQPAPKPVGGNSTLAKDIAVGYCAKCPDCSGCFASLGTDTSVVLEDVVAAADEKGRATIIDMPPFLTSRCRRLNGLLQTVNDRIDSYKACEKMSKSLDNGRMLLAAQMGGMAEILDNLGHDVKQCVSFDTVREKQVIDELVYHNIICKEAIVYGTGAGLGVTVTVREEDAPKAILPKVVSKIMKIKLAREGAPDVVSGSASVHLVPAPKYDFLYGSAMKRREGERACGDIVSVQRVGSKKIVIALCDGMGSGDNAEKYSSRAITMIENLYRAGFSNEVVLALSNKLLTLKNDENYSALALCVVDLDTGGCDIIKQGAPYNLIRRRDTIEIIDGYALPIGIVEEAKPAVERKILFSGDAVILVSDGITDVVSQEDLTQKVQQLNSSNLEVVAEEILNYAVERGATDDSTVLTFRLFVKM